MKKIFFTLSILLLALQGMAQSVFTVKDGDKTYSFPLSSEITVTDDPLWVPDTVVWNDTVLVNPKYKSAYVSVWFAKPNSIYRKDVSKLRMHLVADSLWMIKWGAVAGEKVNFSVRNTDSGEAVNPVSSGSTYGAIGTDTLLSAAGTAYANGGKVGNKWIPCVDWTMPENVPDSIVVLYNEKTMKYRVFGIEPAEAAKPDTVRDTVLVSPTYKTRIRSAIINIDGTGYNNGTKITMKPIGDYKWSAMIPGRAGHKMNFVLNVNLRDEPVPGFTTIPYFMHVGYAKEGQSKLTSAGTIYNKDESGISTTRFETTDFGTDSVEIVMLEDTAKYTTPTNRNLHGTFYILSDNVVNLTDTVEATPTYKTRVRNGYAFVNIDGSGDNNGTRIMLKPVADYTWQAMIPGRSGHTLNFYFNLNSADEPAAGYTSIPWYVHIGKALANNTTMASAGTVYNLNATEGSTAKFQTADFGCDSVRLIFVEDTTAYYSKTNKNTYLDHGTYYILADSIIGGREVIEHHDTVSYYYYPLTILSAADSMGTVTGSGVYRSGTKVTVIATAKDGYEFDKWSDGSTEASRTVTISGIDTLTAYFKVYVAPVNWTYETMYVNASNADYSNWKQEYLSMTKSSTVNTWTWEGTFDEEKTVSFYSEQNYFCDYWGVANWGDNYEASGTCQKSGGDMRIPAGKYKITFNTDSLKYTVTKE